MRADPAPGGYQADLATVLRHWGRIGCIGFGGPPAHIALLRKLCVTERGWMDATEFEDAIAACNLLPGPASTELAIFCAWRVRGRLAALVGGAAFIVPGLMVILALSVLFLAGTPPRWVRGTGAGADAAVAAVAVQAGRLLLVPSWQRAAGSRRLRWAGYLLAGGAAAALIGPWLVFVLLGCGLAELIIRRQLPPRPIRTAAVAPLVALRAVRTAGPAAAKTVAAAAGGGALLAVAWVAFKVGALSFGGGFVIIPLMQADAVGHHWMTSSQFLNGVALGQITPRPRGADRRHGGLRRRRPGRWLAGLPRRVHALVRHGPRRRTILQPAARQLPRSGVPRRVLARPRSAPSWARPSPWPAR